MSAPQSTIEAVVEFRLPGDRFAITTPTGEGIIASAGSRLAREAYRIHKGDLVIVEIDLSRPVPGRIVAHRPAAGDAAPTHGGVSDDADG